jgi:hypothetical protein
MTLTTRDAVLGAAFLLAFPLAIDLTDRAASGTQEPVPPLVAGADAGR